MEPFQALIVPLIVALMTAVKSAPWFEPYPGLDGPWFEPYPGSDGPRRNAWLLPWIAAAIGAGLSILWNQAWPPGVPLSLAAQIVTGLVMGLAAAGLYDGSFQPLKDAARGGLPFDDR